MFLFFSWRVGAFEKRKIGKMSKISVNLEEMDERRWKPVEVDTMVTLSEPAKPCSGTDGVVEWRESQGREEL